MIFQIPHDLSLKLCIFFDPFKKIHLLKNMIINRTKPINIKEEDECLFSHEYIKELASGEHKTLFNVFIDSNGYIYHEKGFSVLPQSFSHKRSRFQSLKSLIKLQLAKRWVARRSISFKKALFLTDECSNNYFHWFCDVLAKLESLLDANNEIGEYTLYIPASAYSAYVAASLKFFPNIRIAVIDKDSVAKCDELKIVPPLAPTGNYLPDVMLKLAERVRSNHLGGNLNQRIKKVFISRSLNDRRKIVNESELLPVLIQHGFQIVTMESLDFEAQVNLLMHADVVASIHGAGLTNMLWMPEGSTVLEIRKADDAHNNCYFSLASALNHKYYYLIADAVNPKERAHSANLVIDIARLDAILKELKKN
ncbi:MAG: hypothetical protein ACI9LM_004989 [Alteromonadaceae bacterium]|jgi:hypothetical protein